jgi:putative transcriptional regulator
VSVTHHPDDTILSAYAAGSLRPGFDIVVAAHLEGCAHCRQAVRVFEQAAGGMLGLSDPAVMDPDALPHLMARIDREPEPAAFVAPVLDTRPLVQRLPVGRRRWLAPGVWVQNVQVPHAREDRVYFLRVGAGIKGINHGHSGPEFTAVVSGALRDGDTVLRAGDFCERGEEHEHQPVVEPDDGGCLCLAATQGSLQARDWMSRVIQMVAGV